MKSIICKKSEYESVLIGHIGAIGVLPNYEKVLELSRKELLEDGTLGKDFDIEIISRNGCGDALEGVAAAADLYHVEHVTTFLGPYCTEEMIAVATMANYWNIPIIAYMATANSLSDKKIYKTLVRTSLRTMNTIAESTAAFVKHYKWRKKKSYGISASVNNQVTSIHERDLRDLRAVIFCEW
ncbi:hypothetical protein NECAME_07536 [Necator americanus]|uniref:Receptor ligand binding region domain-containing protein n=1 Tax=Necator americanus TaxID=51031 RepID=W2TPW7_NECAM|nr:hypothetical protein NECAME_07536 [Necator americanus]ETN83176.1 hypothetical protein NECAME_07536 [Necator americanus]